MESSSQAVAWVAGSRITVAQVFVEITASQLAIVTINVQDLTTLRGDERKHHFDFANEVLGQAQNVVETLV